MNTNNSNKSDKVEIPLYELAKEDKNSYPTVHYFSCLFVRENDTPNKPKQKPD